MDGDHNLYKDIHRTEPETQMYSKSEHTQPWNNPVE